jgi:hypothetical protein
MIGFETIGSATIIAYDDAPILTTDAWINQNAYFGSWAHDYAIPSEQLSAIKRAKFHFMTHGHPDHLNVESLPDLSSGELLIGDHCGGRLLKDLTEMGYKVRVLPTHEWTQLSTHIKVMSFPNVNQDTVLLIDVGGLLIINSNDSPDYGWSYTIRRIASSYRHSYLTALCAWSGADMCNIFHPDGKWVTPPDKRPSPIGPRLQNDAATYGAKYIIPFSSFHRYQRTDSVWANELVPSLKDYQQGAIAGRAEILPAFIRVEAPSGNLMELQPTQLAMVPKEPEEFGDSWSDVLDKSEEIRLQKYFKKIEALHDNFRFLEFNVGGKTTTIDLNSQAKSGISFDAPRHSLMTCIDYEIFDDLLIGNFMRVTLHDCEALYPNFSPYVAKFSDNGRASSRQELKSYFSHYTHADRSGHIFKWVEGSAERVFRRAVATDSFLFKSTKRAYYFMRK